MFEEVATKIKVFDDNGQKGLIDDSANEGWVDNVAKPHLQAAKRLGLDLKGPEMAPTLAPGMGGNTMSASSSKSDNEE